MTERIYQDRIQQKLTTAFSPIHLEIKDDSERHAGHSGHDPRGETHFKVKIVSVRFENIKPIERHRLVYAALADELKERVHALNIQAFSPSEYNHE